MVMSESESFLVSFFRSRSKKHWYMSDIDILADIRRLRLLYDSPNLFNGIYSEVSNG